MNNVSLIPPFGLWLGPKQARGSKTTQFELAERKAKLEQAAATEAQRRQSASANITAEADYAAQVLTGSAATALFSRQPPSAVATWLWPVNGQPLGCVLC